MYNNLQESHKHDTKKMKPDSKVYGQYVNYPEPRILYLTQ